MAVIFILFGGVIVFFIGLISPRLAGKLEHKVDKHSSRFNDKASEWLWEPLAWWVDRSVAGMQKAIGKTARSGKTARKKIEK